MDDFKNLQMKVQQFNAFTSDSFNTVIGNYSMQFGEAISKKDISQLEAICSTKLPEDLAVFYNTLGGLATIKGRESKYLAVATISELIGQLQMSDGYEKLASIGLIHSILNSWGNDRYEFEQDEFFTQTQLEFLNSKYKVFGLYRLGDEFDAAGYLYFDDEDKFGSLYYHQDYFDDLKIELLAMLEKSQATHSLETLLISVIQEIKESI